MNPPRLSSDSHEGLFVTIDGPSAVGKTTTIKHLAQMLASDGVRLHTTTEPSTGPIGQLAYSLTDTIAGPALACLYAADRYHHLDLEIRPKLRDGKLVLCDRYVPSALVMQRLDQLDLGFLWNLNALVDRPHLAVILTAAPEIIAARLKSKRPHNRLQHQVNSSEDEACFYTEAIEHLTSQGYPIHRVDTSVLPPEAVAEEIYRTIAASPLEVVGSVE